MEVNGNNITCFLLLQFDFTWYEQGSSEFLDATKSFSSSIRAKKMCKYNMAHQRLLRIKVGPSAEKGFDEKERKMIIINKPWDIEEQETRNSFTWRLLGRNPGQSYWIFMPMESEACRRAAFCLVIVNSCFLSFPFLKDSRKGGCLKTFSHTFFGCNFLHQYSWI